MENGSAHFLSPLGCKVLSIGYGFSCLDLPVQANLFVGNCRALWQRDSHSFPSFLSVSWAATCCFPLPVATWLRAASLVSGDQNLKIGQAGIRSCEGLVQPHQVWLPPHQHRKPLERFRWEWFVSADGRVCD